MCKVMFLQCLDNILSQIPSKRLKVLSPETVNIETLKNMAKYLTIIPRARVGSESIAHEADGRMGY